MRRLECGGMGMKGWNVQGWNVYGDKEEYPTGASTSVPSGNEKLGDGRWSVGQ